MKKVVTAVALGLSIIVLAGGSSLAMGKNEKSENRGQGIKIHQSEQVKLNTSNLENLNLDQLKAERLKLKEERLTERVNAGVISESEKQEILTQMIERQKTCDGTNQGLGTGQSSGQGQGMKGQGLQIHK